MKLFNTSILALAALSTMAVQANAISRYNTNKMTCEQVQSALYREGAAVLRYPSSRNPSLTLYDRYVSDQSVCDRHSVLERVTVPTKNTSNCPVFHCIPAPDPCDTPLGRFECEGRLRLNR